MTEAEWRTCTDARAMLAILRDKMSVRQMRLFEAACLRRTAVGGEAGAMIDRLEQSADAPAESDGVPPDVFERLVWSLIEIAAGWLTRSPVQAALLRDIVGNPFRPAELEPPWRTSTAVSVAERIYEDRDFAALPILADALEDAGCGVPDVLRHCRSAGLHVRGCWVVDRVLGR